MTLLNGLHRQVHVLRFDYMHDPRAKHAFTSVSSETITTVGT